VIELDHALVPARDAEAAARRLADILGVAWGRAAIGPFVAVYVNAGLTLDFDTHAGDLPIQHYCFRTDEAGFDAVLARLHVLGVPFRSTPHGPVDGQVNTSLHGRIVYWGEPDGHVWELLTASYARPGS
jgi:hypothetical protein